MEPANLKWAAEREQKDFTYTGRCLFEGDTAFSYLESYILRLRGDVPVQALTEYRDPRGTILAERRLDFVPGQNLAPRAIVSGPAKPFSVLTASSAPSIFQWAPGYRFLDRRTGYEEGAELLRSGNVRVYRRTEKGEPLREKTLTVPAPIVVDGGFVPFVRAHWEALLSGSTVPFQFVAVSRLDWFAFEILRDASADREGRVAFIARPRSAALRAFLAPTRVWFDAGTHRLVEFQGRSNLRDDRGRRPDVRITYTPLLALDANPPLLNSP